MGYKKEKIEEMKKNMNKLNSFERQTVKNILTNLEQTAQVGGVQMNHRHFDGDHTVVYKEGVGPLGRGSDFINMNMEEFESQSTSAAPAPASSLNWRKGGITAKPFALVLQVLFLLFLTFYLCFAALV